MRYTVLSVMLRFKTLVCSFVLSAAGLLAQGSAPPPLVYLYPVVTDSGGQPVTDLTANDFKITDQGKPETIFLFRQPITKPASLGPHEISNRPAGAMPHSTAIVFDLMNEVQSDRLDNWHSLAKSIPQLASGQSLYFYVLGINGDLVPIHGVESDSGDDATWPQGFDKPFDKAMKKLAGRAQSVQMGQEDQVKKTYHNLEVVGNELATLPGRGDIVWITNGMPSVYNPNTKIPCSGDWVDCGLYVAHVAVTLEHDNVAVNPFSFSGNLSPSVNYDLEQMGRLTGGHGYFREDIQDVLKEVARAAADRYEIAYDPAAENWDNKFHKIHIDCDRKGVKLQVRERYYAFQDSRAPIDREKAELVAAYRSLSDSPGIGLRATVTPAADQKKVHLAIRVNAADVMFRPQGGKFVGALTFLLSDRGGAGPLGDPTVSTLNLNLTSAQRDNMLKEGIPIPQDHPLAAGTTNVRVIVQDQNTDQVGSLTLPVK